MWIIRMRDQKSAHHYIRENLLDGRILMFDTEEGALRFLVAIRDKVEAGLRVKLITDRYTDDLRKNKPYKVPPNMIEPLTQIIVTML